MDALEHFEAAEAAVMDHYRLEYENHFIELRSPKLRVRVIEVGEGPPLLLVHGGLAYGSCWAPLMAALSGYRLFAVDRPGYGLSGPFVHRREHLREDGVSFLESVLDALGLERVPLIANSMGGLWSFWLASDRPERVASLCQLGCPALLLGTAAPLPMRLLSLRGLNRALVRFGPQQSPQDTFRQMGEASALATVPPAFLECLRAATETPTWWPASFSLLEATLRLGGARLPYGEAELSRVHQPTLFVWGSRDPFGSLDVARRAIDLMPNARLVVLDAGHAPWMAQPERVAETILEHLEASTGAAEERRGEPSDLDSDRVVEPRSGDRRS